MTPQYTKVPKISNFWSFYTFFCQNFDRFHGIEGLKIQQRISTLPNRLLRIDVCNFYQQYAISNMPCMDTRKSKSQKTVQFLSVFQVEQYLRITQKVEKPNFLVRFRRLQ